MKPCIFRRQLAAMCVAWIGAFFKNTWDYFRGLPSAELTLHTQVKRRESDWGRFMAWGIIASERRIYTTSSILYY